LIAAGDNPERLRSDAAFSMLCGVAPIPASSGKTVRHRLTRGGERQPNNARWTIAVCRMSYDPRTIAYVQRRTTEGKSTKEIIPLPQALHRPRSTPRPPGHSHHLTTHRSINKRYAQLAAELALQVAEQAPFGWTATTVPEQTAVEYAAQLAELAAALVLWRRAELTGPAQPSPARQHLAGACACGRRRRIARSVLAVAPILCGACAAPFAPDDPDDQP